MPHYLGGRGKRIENLRLTQAKVKSKTKYKRKGWGCSLNRPWFNPQYLLPGTAQWLLREAPEISCLDLSILRCGSFSTYCVPYGFFICPPCRKLFTYSVPHSFRISMQLWSAGRY
jgi:hypothetical protein